MEEFLGSVPPCPRIVRGQQELTAEQQAYLRHFAHVRLASMLSTTSVDEAEAEAFLRQAYQVAGLKSPQMRWFDSPRAFVLAHVPSGIEVSVQESMWPRLRDCFEGDADCLWIHLWRGVVRRVEDYIETCFGGVGRACLRGSVIAAMFAHMPESVGMGQMTWTSLESSEWSNPWISKWPRLRNDVDLHMGVSAHNSVSAYFHQTSLAFCRFFHEVFEPNDIVHLACFNELVSGYHLGREEAWLVRKPTDLHLDEEDRLHSAEGMCLRYRDGWGLYAWHGVQVPEQLILHPEQLTREDWLTEDNLEVRRAMEERWGNARFLELVGGTCIDRGTRGELIEVDLYDDPEEVAHYVRVRDASTSREYSLRVPPEIQLADEALAWTFGLDEQDYQPAQET